MFNIIMPIAGLGSRFSKAGQPVPKPIIDVAGRPMAAWALSSLTAFLPDCRIVLVILREHVTKFAIDKVLLRHIPHARCIITETLTGGSLETCMLAQAAVHENGGEAHPVIALDGDLVFQSAAYVQTLLAMTRPGGPDGALLSFRASDPRYSFAEVRDGLVTRTAEKVAISDRALVGAYGFARASQFFDIGAAIIARNARVANGEFYTSAAYNVLIGQGGRVQLSDTEQYWSLGTPEELAASLADSRFPAFLESLAGSVR